MNLRTGMVLFTLFLIVWIGGGLIMLGDYNSPSTITTTSQSPSHGIILEELKLNPQYWNTSHEGEALRIWNSKTIPRDDLIWIEEEFVWIHTTLCSVNEEYHATHIYIEDEFDCNDMAVELWNLLYKQGIVSFIVVGNLDMENESFEESNHTWLVIPYLYVSDYFIVEPTNGEVYSGVNFPQYNEGYYYISPSNLRADIKERW